MKLNLGAGNYIKQGYINHDRTKHRPEIDICFDLNESIWAVEYLDDREKIGQKDGFCELENNKWEEIIAFDVIEHVDDVINFMDNCWELLRPDGVLHLKACGWKNPNFHVDITHRRAFDIRSFDYFDPTTELGKEYGYYTDKRWTILSKDHDRHGNILIKLKPIK